MAKKASWQKHQRDEDGEHDPEACYACLLKKETSSACRWRLWSSCHLSHQENIALQNRDIELC
jgi:hypothetical protein